MKRKAGLRNRRAMRAKPAPQRDDEEALLPHELLLRIARGAAVGGHTPTFAERVAAARLALPYYAPRRMPEKGEEQGPLIVNVRRFSDAESTDGGDAGG